MSRVKCGSCGKPLAAPDRGRPRQYCSRACQAKAYRARKAESEEDRGHLTVDRIVRAGIAVADAEGLEALSMRRVAAELGAGTMALYRHVASKDDLVALMVEAALTEVPLPETPPRDWRDGLERAAFLDWDLYHRHPWILAKVLVTTRTHDSPALSAGSEHAFASFDGLDLDPADAFRYMFLFASYVQGVALTYVSDVEAERRGAPAHNPSFADYPRLGSAMRSMAEPWDLDELFASGLSGVLDGIAADLARQGIL
ncbi:TetR/AcrR family transcriptional regulator [Amycolatopsis sp. Poz14]|nr:TetR/AcrR family transcriptional regulator [Amycolatopsis sp. Poz14]